MAFVKIASEPPDNVFVFEGPEKKLEIEFRKLEHDALGFRDPRKFPRSSWDELCTLAKCTILSQTSNEYFDSYVLSESSLFVYPYKVMIKTCGTTTLLKCVPKLLELAEVLGTTPEFVLFSRKNFLFPSRQLAPHTGFEAEVGFLDRFFENGHGYVLGPVTGDHWVLYMADYTSSKYAGGAVDRTDGTVVEVMMTELDPTAMEIYFRENHLDGGVAVSDKELTALSGLPSVLGKDTITDERFFSPCGFSLNGLLDDAYFTVHVTPEAHCSFVSFETNLRAEDYTKMIRGVAGLFRPGKITVSVFSDAGRCSATAFDHSMPGYCRQAKVHCELAGEYNVSISNYVRKLPLSVVRPPSPPTD